MDKKTALNVIKEVFNKYSIPYSLIGAYAASAWGAVRATRDIDFIADIPKDILRKVKDEFEKNGFNVDITKGDIKDPVSGMIKLIFAGQGGIETIDILLGIKGVSKDIFTRIIKVPVLDMELPILPPEDIIIMKLLAGGPLDLDDAKKILKVMDQKIDYKYLKEQCKKKKLNLGNIK